MGSACSSNGAHPAGVYLYVRRTDNAWNSSSRENVSKQDCAWGQCVMAQHAPKAAGDADFARPGRPLRLSPSRHAAMARSRPTKEVETDIPSRLDALPFGRFHLLVIVALGVTWILDGLEVTLAGALSGELMQHSGLGLSNCADRPCRQRLSVRSGSWRLSLRLADRPAGAQEALFDHACGLSARHRGHRTVLECLEFHPVPLPDRRRHRRRIHCHQFDNPGAYPCPPTWLDRPRLSTAVSGSGRPWVQAARSCCLIPH